MCTEAAARHQQSLPIKPKEQDSRAMSVKYYSDDLISCWARIYWRNPAGPCALLLPRSFVNATETAKHYPLVDRFNGLIRTQMIRYFDWRLAPRCYLGT